MGTPEGVSGLTAFRVTTDQKVEFDHLVFTLADEFFTGSVVEVDALTILPFREEELGGDVYLVRCGGDVVVAHFDLVAASNEL